MKNIQISTLLLVPVFVYAMEEVPTVHTLSSSHDKTALISVSDKTGVVDLAKSLLQKGYTRIISTGGTYAHLQNYLSSEEALCIESISDITKFPEMLGGRVKTLHPKIFGGILACKNNRGHMNELEEHAIAPIDLVVVNLYPFEDVIQNPATTREIAIENIDIGGVALVRAAAKNYKHVTVMTSPNDYCLLKDPDIIIGEDVREVLAYKAFEHVTKYDMGIMSYFSNKDTRMRFYIKDEDLKYGLNPHQKEAALYTINGQQSPFQILNGKPSYINMLDALGSWQLVSEAKKVTGLTCAASFKHTSPAGVGLDIALSDIEKKAYGVDNKKLSSIATAFVRARQADPKSSFGDFIAVSDVIDRQSAELIAREVSDGIIAPGYTQEAEEILRSKKGGNYLIVQVNPEYTNNQNIELRELYGIALAQEPNRAITTKDFLQKIVTVKTHIPDNNQRDLMLANIALKYTQSNSIAYAKNGQIIGVGAGQQNRVDCVTLAGKKAAIWWLRQHPKAIELWSKFKSDTKRHDKINAVMQYVKGKEINNNVLVEQPAPFTKEERMAFLHKLTDVSMASDGFFPFRDNIDEAAQYGVKYVVQPGGSIADSPVTQACNEHEMTMALSGVRVFTH